MHSQFASRFALPGMSTEGSRRLGGALAASLVVHALLLSWPVSLPAAGPASAGPTRAAVKAFSVTLRSIAEPEIHPFVEVAQAAPLEQAPLVAAKEDKPAETPKNEHADPNSIALVGYYPADKLTRMPEAVGTFDVQPPPGGDTGLSGKVTIRIWIGANGAIDRLRVMDSGLPQAYAEAAISAFEKLRFRPGEIGGVPVRAWVDVVIEYADFRDAVPAGGRN